VAGYASKPISRDELLEVLARVLHLAPGDTKALVTRHGLADTATVLEVLLVEDHAINQKLAVTLLERWGHRVTVAENGQLALDALQKQRFDVVLMDMMMPVMDGLEATRRIRASESGQRVPIIAMTANAMESDRERCLEAGMDDYLSKPIKAQELQAMLQRFAALLLQGNAPVAQVHDDALGVGNRPLLAFDYAAGLEAMDQEIREIIAQAFIDQWPEDWRKLRTGLDEGNQMLVLHTAHSLKGTLSMFGAKPASELARQMESLAGKSDIVRLAELLEPLCVEVEHLLAAISAGIAA
jgi:CheY-like chemotaxis protein/HPt (histidine-containing phosphotransfer) domain-containing protein